MLGHMPCETNRYAEHDLQLYEIRTWSAVLRWEVTIDEEMLKFLEIITQVIAKHHTERQISMAPQLLPLFELG